MLSGIATPNLCRTRRTGNPHTAHVDSRTAVLYIAILVNWGFLTNHARALICIARDPSVRLRDIAATLDITERSAYTIVTDLTDAGYVIKEKDGRRSRYQIQGHLPLRGSIGRERTIGEILDVLVAR